MNIFDRNNFVLEFIRLLGRLLRYPVPTIALVNGHAVAGGCMFMFAHDWRIARAEPKKAHCSLPEIEIGFSFLIITFRYVSSSRNECSLSV